MNADRSAHYAVRTVPPNGEPYRYVLELGLAGAPARRWLTVIMKNPSTASGPPAVRLDPTIGKVRAWAGRHGFDTLCVVNLFARRATHPTALNAQSYASIVGSANDRFIQEAAARADTLVAGWGNPNGLDPERYARRIEDVLALLSAYPLHVVGPLTRLGHPRHGLLWNGGAELARWKPVDHSRRDTIPIQSGDRLAETNRRTEGEAEAMPHGVRDRPEPLEPARPVAPHPAGARSQ